MEEDKTKSETTFRFVVNNFKDLKEPKLSPPFYIWSWETLSWKILVKMEGEPKSLGFFLYCNNENESPNWSCLATATFKLISHIPNRISDERKFQRLFSSKTRNWGCKHFMLWSDIMNPVYGYVNDGAIIIEVHISVDAPTELTSTQITCVKNEPNSSTQISQCRIKELNKTVKTLQQQLINANEEHNELRKAILEIRSKIDCELHDGLGRTIQGRFQEANRERNELRNSISDVNGKVDVLLALMQPIIASVVSANRMKPNR